MWPWSTDLRLQPLLWASYTTHLTVCDSQLNSVKGWKEKRIKAVRFHMGYKLPVVCARICMFPVDILLTEFAINHITWHIEVVLKLLCSVLSGKVGVFPCFSCWLCWLFMQLFWHDWIVWGWVGVFVKWHTGGPTHWQPLGMFSRDKNFPLSH